MPKKEYRDTPAIRLKVLRSRRGLSQRELANLSGYTQQTISYYESGKRSITREAADAFSEHIGASADYILGNTDFLNYTDYFNHKTREKIDLFTAKNTLIKKLGYTITPYQLDFHHNKKDEYGDPLDEDEYRFDEDGCLKNNIELVDDFPYREMLDILDNKLVLKPVYDESEFQEHFNGLFGEIQLSEAPGTWEDYSDVISHFLIEDNSGNSTVVAAENVFQMIGSIEKYISMRCDELINLGKSKAAWDNRYTF